jgi:FixJ family two-component response regulator
MASTASTAVPACILFDLHNPESSGIDTLRRLNAPAYPAPVLMMSEEGGIATASGLIRDGAYDFLEKPFSSTELIQRIERAKLLYVCKTPSAHEPLTSREQEVLTHWVSGATTKEIAREFGISPRTIDVHRSKIMKKLHAKNSAELVKIVVSNNTEFGVRLSKAG